MACMPKEIQMLQVGQNVSFKFFIYQGYIRSELVCFWLGSFFIYIICMFVCNLNSSQYYTLHNMYVFEDVSNVYGYILPV